MAYDGGSMCGTKLNGKAGILGCLSGHQLSARLLATASLGLFQWVKEMFWLWEILQRYAWPRQEKLKHWDWCLIGPGCHIVTLHLLVPNWSMPSTGCRFLSFPLGLSCATSRLVEWKPALLTFSSQFLKRRVSDDDKALADFIDHLDAWHLSRLRLSRDQIKHKTKLNCRQQCQDKNCIGPRCQTTILQEQGEHGKALSA